jgi:hypothetical protein
VGEAAAFLSIVLFVPIVGGITAVVWSILAARLDTLVICAIEGFRQDSAVIDFRRVVTWLCRLPSQHQRAERAIFSRSSVRRQGEVAY